MAEVASSDVPLASPLTLLWDESQNLTKEYEDILFMSYTLDLGYFEKIALGVGRALGARITTVGDASVVRNDPLSVRNAGKNYMSGLASCRGAFHPKVFVMSGKDSIVAAIGSGNLTISGWESNEELWSVFRANSESGTETLQQLAIWLRDLEMHVRLSPGVGEVLQRIAHRIQTFPVTEAGPHFISNLVTPILDQLPMGPVDQLNVYSPFHDPASRALHLLTEHLSPKHVTVGIQPGLTVCDGSSIAEVVNKFDNEVRELSTKRYRHGKLIEGIRGSERWALTGSPNCSLAALVRSVNDGGNCEVGVISDISQTLMPKGEPLSRTSLLQHHYRPQGISRPSVLILGAAVSAEMLQVSLVRPLQFEASLEISRGRDTETWETFLDLKKEQQDFVIKTIVQGGDRLRISYVDESNKRMSSNTVFIQDPRSIEHRVGNFSRARQGYNPPEFFDDSALAQRFALDLEDLPKLFLTKPRSQAGVVHQANSARPPKFVSWEEYLDSCDGRIGGGMVNFALGLPDLFDQYSVVSNSDESTWIEELVSDDEAGVDDDLGLVPDSEPINQKTDFPDLTQMNLAVRQRYQKWAEKLSLKAGKFEPLGRLAAMRLILWTVAAGAWENEDWVQTVARATTALGQDDIPTELENEAGSLAGVSLSVMRSVVILRTTSQDSLRYRHAVQGVKHLLVEANEELIAEYSRFLEGIFGSWLEPSNVKHFCDTLIQGDKIADSITVLRDEFHYSDIHRHEDVLHLPGKFSNPLIPALQAVGIASEELDSVGAYAGDEERWSLVVWDHPFLGVISGGKSDSWILYRLNGFITPKTCASERRIPSHLRENRSFGPTQFPDVLVSALEKIGINSPHPPSCVP